MRGDGPPKREVVVPGDLLGTGLKPGLGTFSVGGKTYASQLGIKRVRGDYVNIIPLSGRYMPRQGDTVIGEITDIAASYWLVDINAPYPAPLHASEVPWKVDFGDTSRFLNVEDVVLLKVLSVDEAKRIQVTMKERDLGRLRGGRTIDVSNSKVPRIIGRKGSMIGLIKEYTECRMFVGQNGRIWLDGSMDGMYLAVKAIRRIEEDAQVLGLTESIEVMLREATAKKA
ncbi:MAG: S1 RNA-binding domain-containing protein [Thermoplasmata archaeon]|nr:S1 RNA-binding domain-containing protein [Thermoplasmata archaeon]